MTQTLDAPRTRPIGPIVTALADRGADRAAHGRGSVLRHLVNTHAILSGWNQPERLCLAGLAHNVYSTDGHEAALFDPGDRAPLRALLGERAERLVHLFGGLSRVALFEAVSERPAPTAVLRLPDRRGGPMLRLGPRDIGDLLVLYLANVADQACLRDGGPTHWLARASELLALAVPRAEVVPPVLDRGRTRVTVRAEEEGLEAYDTALRVIARDRAGAAARLDTAMRLLPCVGEPAILRGLLHLATGDRSAGRAAMARGAAALRAWGTPWDKRLGLSEWLRLAGSDHWPEAGFDGVTASPRDLLAAPLPEGGDIRVPPRFRTYVARRKADPGPHGPGVGIYPGLSARPWHDAPAVPVARALEEAAGAIAEEFAALHPADFADESEDIARTGRWTVLFLHGEDGPRDDVRAACPVTAGILDAHGAAVEGAGVAYFSRLAPGTRIASHRGATNTRLRLHLGIDIPAEGCTMTVAGEAGTWRTGRCTVFDDSFFHDVRNDSPDPRVVLIVDLWHPDLSPQEVALLRWLAE
ncbi:Aspartyl/Asparaginyl beta-hydroxylase [Jannaschia rubra]|uniref:Aspartyl/Asparaginyl beta-hydroxylase n=2 Tax=Jannaschia rubra TaxID=282197 RepID=A0A0M6XV06_9RHOB|nr:aspartyl/asparaginyl beta-hydroxylase domain-containing protein [Jannaschia rubra]CTQ34598.1 Aspartyl/Asparaginyl beta-hydroxylase [Jannaschia rubra]SFG72269.1 Aspartyl/Asparaginyl beta-hydroxylase [Jannaschia rubra]